ncbi:MAG TPA: 50S ribosomal protein L16 [Candidatus Hydrothermia bacterium]|nr:50S ribosomal protein L16 [Candidatus Hydrothermae bacterium]MDD3648931.1 50S ribosomal protein L16 [Candidatus Hydrothermia bacterium]MDD5573397.1 50S ribosomal protein L16 [Candidatus Hydrothermia bacterium]HOK23172.1 50S ribosomal protein L16 [Candidatus Hydrothermia bacterium]HOL23876.1 50S ribosomal protein L16 [Candidatus Hydrothermia bacterium]
MLMPSRTKYRKQQRGRLKGVALAGNYLAFGEFGLKTMEADWLTANQIESARMAISRYLKKGGKLWVRVFPDKPFTKKPAETRMGKGKGNVELWVAVVKPGRILFELSGVSEEDAREAFRIASYKLPVKTRFVSIKEGGV